MFDDMQIYIPSMGRASKQVTLRHIPAEFLPRTFLVVPVEEVEFYKTYCPDPRLGGILGCPAKGIGPTRQFIMEQAQVKFVFMFDDDMYIYRRIGDTVKLAKATPFEVCELFTTMRQWLVDGYAHVGLSARQGNNHVAAPYKDLTRMCNAYAHNVEIFRHYGLRFDRTHFMEDFDLTLSLLELGFPNRVMFQFCWNQVGSNEGGGCSTYRTGERQAEAAHKLKELHGDVVRVVQKISKPGSGCWKGMKTRTDVVISWQKALKTGTLLKEIAI